MIRELLQPEIQDFIEKNAAADIQRLALQRNKYGQWPFDKVLDQIRSKQKAKHKLPHWFQTKGLLYPPLVSMEQCSSEVTAQYKASLVQGKSLLDLTGGFGIDVSYMSESFNQSTYVERNPWLCDLARHNFSVLGKAIQVYQMTAKELLEGEHSFDLIYADPARRGVAEEKVIRLEDYSPNVRELLPKIQSKGKHYLFKVSPMFDIKLGLKQLEGVEEVHVVSYKNEVKELLFLGKRGYASEPTVIANNLQSQDELLKFKYSDEQHAQIEYGSISSYLYEPNASIIKAGAFKTIAWNYQLQKLHANTHLYTSSELRKNFPGRIFRVIKEVKPNKKQLKQALPHMKANISVRNYPLSVQQIRLRTAIKEGGEQYLFGFTDIGDKRLVLCEKLEKK